MGRSQGSAQLVRHIDEKWKRRTLIGRYYGEQMANPVIDQFQALDGCHDDLGAIVEANMNDLLITADAFAASPSAINSSVRRRN